MTPLDYCVEKNFKLLNCYHDLHGPKTLGCYAKLNFRLISLTSHRVTDDNQECVANFMFSDSQNKFLFLTRAIGYEQ